MSIRAKTAAPAMKHAISGASVIAAQMSIAPGTTTVPYRVIALSRDRTTFYAVYSGTSGRKNGIAKSMDGGVTWTNIRNFAAISANVDLVAFLELPSGEVIIALSSFGTFPAQIYKSTGWAANPATATFSLKTTLIGGSLTQGYSMNPTCMGSNGVLLASESGPQTAAPSGLAITNAGTGYTSMTLAATSGGTGEDIRVYLLAGKIERIGIINGGTGHTNGTFSFGITGDGTSAAVTYTVSGGVISGVQTATARRLFLSTDFGNTWTNIYDIYLSPTYKYGVGVHIHACAYDEAWDRIWLQFGDNTGDGLKISGSPTNTQILYSDDRGVTWTFLPAEQYLTASGVQAQYTSIRIYKDNIVFGADAQYDWCMVVFPRTGYRQLGNAEFATGATLKGSGIAGAQISAYSADDSLPVFSTYALTSTGVENPVVCTSDAGSTWYEFWRETDLVTRPAIANGGPSAFYGPDTSNRIVANYYGYNALITGALVTNL